MSYSRNQRKKNKNTVTLPQLIGKPEKPVEIKPTYHTGLPCTCGNSGFFLQSYQNTGYVYVICSRCKGVVQL